MIILAPVMRVARNRPKSETKIKEYLVPERKPRSGTILDFGLRILDSKKKEISVSLKFSSKTGKLYFEVFVQTLTTQVVRFTVQGFPLKAGFRLRRGRIFHIA